MALCLSAAVLYSVADLKVHRGVYVPSVQCETDGKAASGEGRDGATNREGVTFGQKFLPVLVLVARPQLFLPPTPTPLTLLVSYFHLHQLPSLRLFLFIKTKHTHTHNQHHVRCSPVVRCLPEAGFLRLCSPGALRCFLFYLLLGASQLTRFSHVVGFQGHRPRCRRWYRSAFVFVDEAQPPC